MRRCSVCPLNSSNRYGIFKISSQVLTTGSVLADVWNCKFKCVTQNDVHVTWKAGDHQQIMTVVLPFIPFTACCHRTD